MPVRTITLQFAGSHLCPAWKETMREHTLCIPGPSCLKVFNAIHQINRYPVDSVVWVVKTNILDRYLSGG